MVTRLVIIEDESDSGHKHVEEEKEEGSGGSGEEEIEERGGGGGGEDLLSSSSSSMPSSSVGTSSTSIASSSCTYNKGGNKMESTAPSPSSSTFSPSVASSPSTGATVDGNGNQTKSTSRSSSSVQKSKRLHADTLQFNQQRSNTVKLSTTKKSSLEPESLFGSSSILSKVRPPSPFTSSIKTLSSSIHPAAGRKDGDQEHDTAEHGNTSWPPPPHVVAALGATSVGFGVADNPVSVGDNPFADVQLVRPSVPTSNHNNEEVLDIYYRHSSLGPGAALFEACNCKTNEPVMFDDWLINMAYVDENRVETIRTINRYNSTKSGVFFEMQGVNASNAKTTSASFLLFDMDMENGTLFSTIESRMMKEKYCVTPQGSAKIFTHRTGLACIVCPNPEDESFNGDCCSHLLEFLSQNDESSCSKFLKQVMLQYLDELCEKSKGRTLYLSTMCDGWTIFAFTYGNYHRRLLPTILDMNNDESPSRVTMYIANLWSAVKAWLTSLNPYGENSRKRKRDEAI